MEVGAAAGARLDGRARRNRIRLPARGYRDIRPPSSLRDGGCGDRCVRGGPRPDPWAGRKEDREHQAMKGLRVRFTSANSAIAVAAPTAWLRGTRAAQKRYGDDFAHDSSL